MGLPKKRKKNIDVKRVASDYGPERWVEQFLDQNKQFLPRSVDYDDMDKGFIEFVENDLGVVINGEKVPVHALSLQRWNEFSKTWVNSDKYGNMKIPFVSVVRKPDVQPGTNPADFKIPVRKNFPYMKIQIWNGSRNGSDIYTIPNPVGADLTYTVRFFSYRMKELNKLHQKVLQTFASAQAYINIKGHYFPILLENIGDESQVDDLEGKRFYVQSYEMKLQGYVVDQEEFEVKPAITRAFLTTEISSKKLRPITTFIKEDTKDAKTIKIIVEFLPSAPTTVTFKPYDKSNFTLVSTDNISDYTIRVNGNIVSTPFIVESQDNITIDIVKIDSLMSAKISLLGILLL
jgi:hypothetical protein